MIEIKSKKNTPAYLVRHAREFCEKIGATDIHDICCLGDGDYRIMYNIRKDDKIKMEAIILKVPSE